METEDVRTRIEQFLAAPSFAVVGASADPEKFGHRCFASYLRHGRRAYPINPREESILGHTAYPSLGTLPEQVESVTIVTPPAVTERVVEDAIASGVRHLWMQPGAESPAAIARAREAGISVIAGGPCLLVELGRLAVRQRIWDEEGKRREAQSPTLPAAGATRLLGGSGISDIVAPEGPQVADV